MRIAPSPASGGLSFLVDVLSPLSRVHLGPCRFLAESCHLSSRLLRLTFGISLQDGYSRGSSRTSFSQAVSPRMLPPSSHPWAQQHPLLSLFSQQDPAPARGVCGCHRVGMQMAGDGCVATTPATMSAEPHAPQSVRQTLLAFCITDLVGFLSLP